MTSEIDAFLATGSLNKENFFLDGEHGADSTRVSVGGIFSFSIQHAAPFTVSLIGSAGSRALTKMLARIKAKPASSITAVLSTVTVEYQAISDELDAENAGDDDAYAEPGALDAFDQANAEALEEAKRLADEKQREYDATFGAIQAQFDITTLPKQTVDRILSDYASVKSSKHFGWTAAPRGRDLASWDVDFFEFDKDTPLRAEMQEFAKRTGGKPHVQLEMLFPREYPFKPPFIRVIRPRFMPRTGHVTVGGSICTQLLTDEGWKPIYDIESIMETIRQQITDKESGARIDTSNTTDYTMSEAKEAFTRVAEYHRVNGW